MVITGLRSWVAMRKVHGTVAAYAFTALVALMPLWPNMLPLCLVAGLMALVVHHHLWQQRPQWTGTWSTAMPWALLLFLLHVVGLAWSSNMDYATFDLQIKLPLGLLPVVAILLPRTAHRGWSGLLLPFVLGNVAAVLLCTALVPYRVLTTPDAFWTYEVFGERFSCLVHPSYFALYLCFALAVWYLAPMPEVRRVWRMPVAVVLCLGIVLCGSKAGWLALPWVVLVALIATWRRRDLRRELSLLIATSAIGVVGLVALAPGVQARVIEAWDALHNEARSADAATSSEVRKLAWHSAAEVARAHAPWGTGTGDVKDELIAAHERHGYVHLVEKRINAHSEYLQLWAALGVAGLVGCIALVLVPALAALRHRRYWVFVFFLLNGANWLVESMLEVQAGVLFFAFFAFVCALDPEQTDIRSGT